MHQQQRWQYHRQQCQQPAAPEQGKRQGQQCEDQEIALVLPGIRRPVQRQGFLGVVQWVRGQQGIEVAVVDLHATVGATGGRCQIPQGLFVQARHHNSAVLILDEASAGQRNRCARRRADAHDCQLRIAARHDLRDAGAVFFGYTIGDQQYFAAAYTSGAQQIQALGDGTDRFTAGQWHHLRVERRQQIGDGRCVIRERGDDMGVARVGDKACLPLASLLQKVQQFLSGPIQSGGRQVGCIHGKAQIQQHYQRILLLVYRLRNFLPAGASGSQRGEQPAEKDDRQQVAAARDGSVTDQMLQQLGRDDRLPAAGATALSPQQNQQHQCRHQGPQPLGSHPVDFHQRPSCCPGAALAPRQSSTE